jgi:hypothetical protein
MHIGLGPVSGQGQRHLLAGGCIELCKSGGGGEYGRSCQHGRSGRPSSSSPAVLSSQSRNGCHVAVLLGWFSHDCMPQSEGEKHRIIRLVRRKGGQTEARGGGVSQVECPTLIIWLTAVGLCLRGNKGGVSYPCCRGVLRSLVCSLQRSAGCAYKQVLSPRFSLPPISSDKTIPLAPLQLYIHFIIPSDYTITYSLLISSLASCQRSILNLLHRRRLLRMRTLLNRETVRRGIHWMIRTIRKCLPYLLVHYRSCR